MDITPASQVPSGSKAQAHHEYKNLLEGIHFKFPTFKHEHPPVINVNEVADEQLTVGQKVADTVAGTVGSWRFIIIQSIVLAIWLALNITGIVFRWDPYPFILLNLALSFQAAYAAPFVMMSQNRQSEKDRLMAESDYHCNTKGEEEVRNIMEHLDHQDVVIMQIIKRMEAQHEEVMQHLARLDPEMARRLGMDIQEVSKELVEEATEGGTGGTHK
ncbi:MAG TPA: DUF1003 domain-containing protein [Ktedonobacteraceae bacterium]|nr:DUF1003 domain-containing protein [Ktedonobacteraceae bacterium]